MPYLLLTVQGDAEATEFFFNPGTVVSETWGVSFEECVTKYALTYMLCPCDGGSVYPTWSVSISKLPGQKTGEHHSDHQLGFISYGLCVACRSNGNPNERYDFYGFQCVSGSP